MFKFQVNDGGIPNILFLILDVLYAIRYYQFSMLTNWLFVQYSILMRENFQKNIFYQNIKSKIYISIIYHLRKVKKL